VDPKFRSSFIPKKPLAPKTGGVKVRRRTSFNMMTFVSSLIFVVAAAGSAGVYGYKYILQNRIDQKGVELTDARKKIQINQIEEFKLLDQRIDQAWGLLRNHKVTSAFFDFLEDYTLHNVQFDSYNYLAKEGDEKDMVVRLEGQSGSFESLVLQADILKQQMLISNVKFSEVNRDTQGNSLRGSGNVQFLIETQLNPTEVAYMISSSEQQ